ncbi:16S rRNA (cytosine967-C5)-methyltransferase [Rhodobacter aestuarii]|uniref:16S rRNA (Cytosine967-C5)-methyltransferase n=1 Tax=Rhodobacter aestuarii TaxID=453582 RepID=A0A1N7PUW6_9RHOB|nr:transcription antitermination factor NusB [Rhodobacter aestuarii]PTV94152.1 16S rRNA (cytosine967-C5)-methyltransferase [Rhodobacter aestuarii]SIT14340.1 16S rRNA (cytosine967-C5)-methyltransferase [Rhodobacter aestuarii]
MASIDPARRAAAALLVGVLEERLTLAEQAGELAALPPQDRARAQRLALATLRNLPRADAMLKPHLRKKPPADLLAVLRLGTVEICALDAAPHGVVDALVTLTHSGGRRAEGFAGLINAVLRKVAADTARWQRLDPPALPGWLRGRLMSAYGKVAVMKMEAAHHAGAPVDLSVKADAAAWAEKLGAELLPTGSLRLAQAGQITDLPGYAAGDWWVQDAAAALPAKLLAAQPGETVLDLCAAPGGKTLQLAAMGADVTALDISAPRLDRLQENLARCQVTAKTAVADALEWQPEAPFDAILLDAPCSATGTIRRHPDLPFVKDAKGIKELVALQAQLIDRALGWLKPGGRLVYATCSLLPEEGEAQLAAALERHPDWRINAPEIAGIDPAWITDQGAVRLRPDTWPERGGMDGFFMAVLKRAT